MSDSARKIQAPTGTRDLYPDDVLARRYLTQTWRDTAIRCGFEEIEGPTFEHLDLYTIKSGEGIVSELFSFRRSGGEKDYALRPEFTPTLARMYAARAQQLPKPCKWFTAGPYFRAERPQRGRLREFLQWNMDFLADDGTPAGRAVAETEIEHAILSCFMTLGLGPGDVTLRLSHRTATANILRFCGVPDDKVEAWFGLLDRAQKIPFETYVELARALGAEEPTAQRVRAAIESKLEGDSEDATLISRLFSRDPSSLSAAERQFAAEQVVPYVRELAATWLRLGVVGLNPSPVRIDFRVVRGLAYYTGLVFEATSKGERAVCGGGRYDGLVELFGGPATPAVGFGMGDVVLGLLLEERDLWPRGAELADAVSRAPASARPEVFVISADDEATDPIERGLVLMLRSGVESGAYRARGGKPWERDRYEARSGGVRPMHARQSYKSTRNLKKLLGDAERQQAKFAAIVHGPERVQLKDLDRRVDLTPSDLGVGSIAEFSAVPTSPVYVGRAVAALLG